MMENAGKGLADEIELAYSHYSPKKVLALVGSGNNGGDALVALCYLALRGWETSAYIVHSRPDDDLLIGRYVKHGGIVLVRENDDKYIRLQGMLDSNQLIIDGVLGTGIHLPLRGEVAQSLLVVKQHLENQKTRSHVVAVDCPSGVDCDTGDIAPETIPADMTVTMGAIKMGLLRFPAANITGILRVVSIGSIDNLQNWQKINRIIYTKDEVREILPSRPRDAHKGSFGTAYIIAGSVNYTGAALLAGMAAYRVGAGLVTMAIPSLLHTALSGQFPEATWILLPHEMGGIAANAAQIVIDSISRATAVLFGPGFGLDDKTRDFISRLIGSGGSPNNAIGFIHGTDSITSTIKSINKPVIIDADGLKLLAKIPDWTNLLPPLTVLTPHPGEMGVLTGLSIGEIQSDRIKIAEKYSSLWGHIVVLKGAFTIIASPDGRTAVVPIATPALARAGTGDVLAGLIVGLRAQGVDAFSAACAGVWIHGNAGLLAARRLGNNASVIAGDVLNAVPQVISELL
jgi:NAD(P)H-hydrate epimerase